MSVKFCAIRAGSVPIFEPLESRQLLSASPVLPDVVLEWNDVALRTLQQDSTRAGPGQASRSLAIVHSAIYDAVNAIQGTGAPIFVSALAKPGTHLTAAAASAAHYTLVKLYPKQKKMLDRAFEETLDGVPDGKGEKQGVQLGEYVAKRVMAARKDDGADASEKGPLYFLNMVSAGNWSPDPLNPDQQPLGPKWGLVKPFVMKSADQFAPPPPPAMNTPQYTAAYNEVKRLGARDSTSRTAEQTEIGLFWAYDRPGMGTPIVLFNRAVQTIAKQEKNSVGDNARLFALANVAMADAGIAAWKCKYDDFLWRPITGIRGGDSDGNPATQGDPSWTPLGAPGGGIFPDFTPPFPAYVSGHSTFGAATFRVLQSFYDTDEINFTLTSEELPGVKRSYSSFSQAAQENGVSRIYLGIHWSFDDTEGQKLGRAVADHVLHQIAKPG